MKKIYYLFVGLLMMGLEINGVAAKDAPTFTSTLNVTKGSGTITISTNIKNATTICNDTGVKNGHVYIYLNSDEIEIPANLLGIAVYRNYNEDTNNFNNVNMSCSYNSTEKAIDCNFGRAVTNSNSALINYSDCKDEIQIDFTTKMCANATDCNIKLAVKGEAIDYNGGNSISISGGTTTLYEKTYTCNGGNTLTTTSNTVTNTTNTTNTTNVENPNTLDQTNIYFVIGIVSLVFMSILLKPDKKVKKSFV